MLVSNTNQIEEAYRLIKRTGKRKIAMLGLSFKPGTDDLRESPIATLVEMLLGKGHEVAIYDREVLLARLHGSNRAYIEQTIPHISRLMKASVDERARRRRAHCHCEALAGVSGAAASVRKRASSD